MIGWLPAEGQVGIHQDVYFHRRGARFKGRWMCAAGDLARVT